MNKLNKINKLVLGTLGGTLVALPSFGYAVSSAECPTTSGGGGILASL